MRQTKGKACVIVVRRIAGQWALLALNHPTAGKQWIKGTIQTGETPHTAARRELYEESGLLAPRRLVPLCTPDIGKQPWFIFGCYGPGLPKRWSWATRDDHGHRFNFFWHPIGRAPEIGWHPTFQQVFAEVAPRIRPLTPSDLIRGHVARGPVSA